MRIQFGIAKGFGLALLVAGCNVLPDEIEITTDQDLEKPAGYKIRIDSVLASTETIVGNTAQSETWAIYGPDSTDTPLGTGVLAQDQKDLDITTVLGELDESKLFTVKAWRDLDKDGLAHPLEPAGQSVMTIDKDTLHTEEYDTNGNKFWIYITAPVVYGDGGPGSVSEPIVLTPNRWQTVEMFAGGSAAVSFDVDVVADYVLITGLNSSIQYWDGTEEGITGSKVIQSFSVGAHGARLFLSDVFGASQVAPAKVLLMRLPANGANAAHLVVENEDFGRNALDIFPFVSVVTWETGLHEWLAGQEINFSRTKEGDELNNPVAQFLNYGNNYSNRTLNYTAPTGQAFSGFNDNGDCQVFGEVTGFSDMEMQFDDGDGPYIDASAMIASCTVSGGGNQFNVTAAFRR